MSVSRPYHVALVAGHYRPSTGGVESHVEHIARLLASDGHSVEVLTLRHDRSWPPVESLDGVLVRRFAVPVPSRTLAVSPALWCELRWGNRAYDLIHAHSYHSFAPLAAATAGCQPLVFTPHYHGTGHSPLRKLLHVPYRQLGKSIVGHSQRIICVSNAEARLLRSRFPQADGRIRVIPNGVDREAVESAEPMVCEGTLVVSAGRLESYKHVERTIAAIAGLPDEFKLVVLGDGPDRGRLERRALDLGLETRAQFRGRVDVDELYRWYRRADVYVTMSTNEAMGMALVETLIAGARVVASDIPAHRELAESTSGAVSLVPVQASALTLAEAIRQAAVSPSRPPTVWDWPDVAVATLAVYREVMEAT